MRIHAIVEDAFAKEGPDSPFECDDAAWWAATQATMRARRAWFANCRARSSVGSSSSSSTDDDDDDDESVSCALRWSPGPEFQARLASTATDACVLVCCSGINGGWSGPSGLYTHLARVLPHRAQGRALGVLQVDTLHKLRDAVPVLRAAMRWLTERHPEVHGRVILLGCSMGAATIAHVAAATFPAVCGMISLSGQSGSTQLLTRGRHFAGMRFLAVHGDHDLAVSPAALAHLARRAQRGGADVQAIMLEQRRRDEDAVPGRDRVGETEIIRWHHMWDERFAVRSAVLRWLDAPTEHPRTKKPLRPPAPRAAAAEEQEGGEGERRGTWHAAFEAVEADDAAGTLVCPGRVVLHARGHRLVHRDRRCFGNAYRHLRGALESVASSARDRRGDPRLAEWEVAALARWQRRVAAVVGGSAELAASDAATESDVARGGTKGPPSLFARPVWRCVVPSAFHSRQDELEDDMRLATAHATWWHGSERRTLKRHASVAPRAPPHRAFASMRVVRRESL